MRVADAIAGAAPEEAMNDEAPLVQLDRDGRALFESELL